jgi:hypothetical protein
LVLAGQYQHGGIEHVLVRRKDGATFIFPAWMTANPSLGEIVAHPRLPVNRLIEVREIVDRIMIASSAVNSVGGHREEGSECSTGSIPRARITPEFLSGKAVEFLQTLLIEAISPDLAEREEKDDQEGSDDQDHAWPSDAKRDCLHPAVDGLSSDEQYRERPPTIQSRRESNSDGMMPSACFPYRRDGGELSH